MGLSQGAMANYIKDTNPRALRTLQRIRFALFSGDQTREKSWRRASYSVCVCVCSVQYQSLHGLDMRRVDGQSLLIPAFGLIHIAPQLGYLPPHVQHVMGCGEEVGRLLCAGRGFGGLRHAGVYLSCQRSTDRKDSLQSRVHQVPFCFTKMWNKHHYLCRINWSPGIITVNKWDNCQHYWQPLRLHLP